MRSQPFLPLLLMAALVNACTSGNSGEASKPVAHSATEKVSSATNSRPAAVADPENILSSTRNFMSYKEQHVGLHRDFTPLNDQYEKITKQAFMQALSTGQYLPLAMKGGDSLYYQLYPIGNKADAELKRVIINWSREAHDYYRQEGQPLASYRFTDLEGRVYTPENTKGKIVVMKCWFINCLPCRQEMPALNQLRAKYKDRDDILFLAVNWDSRQATQDLLQKTAFDYTIIADQYAYLTEKLKLNAYPTHFVINREGRIMIKSNDHKAMEEVLEKAAGE